MKSILFFSMVLLAGSATAASIPQSERDALVALGAGLGVTSLWQGPPGTECSWPGVTCDATPNVIGISLPNSIGELSALQPFTKLQVFDVHNTNPQNALYPDDIIGGLPNVAGLTELRVLDVGGNALQGDYPDFSGLTNLQTLDLSGNEFSGPPPVLDGLANLQTLKLSNERGALARPSLTGLPSLRYLTLVGYFEFPDLGGVPHLTTFDASDLVGPISSLSGLNELQHLALYGFHMTGGLPPLQGLPHLQEVYVNFTHLTGPVPDISGLGALQHFELTHNPSLAGPLAALTGLPALQSFRIDCDPLDQCTLGGPMPALGDLPSLQVFSIQANRISGSMPAFGALPALQTFDVANNQLSGAIPSLQNLGALTTFDVSHNALTGNLPAVGGLSSLKNFNASNNRLQGSIPQLGGATVLEFYQVERNQLTGPLPTLPETIWFTAQHNHLSGPIPPVNLSTLDVSDNELSGTIPALGPRVAVFRAAGNHLSGPIPSLASTTVSWFDVSNNDLSGPFPALDSQMSLFDISNNALTGDLPAVLNLPYMVSFNISFNQLTGVPPTFPYLYTAKLYQSALCPNRFTHVESDFWDAALLYAPWYTSCVDTSVNLDQFGLTGSWYNPATSGQGLLISVTPDLFGVGQASFFGGWFTYFADPISHQVKQRWFSLQGQLDAANPYATVGLFDTQGGVFDSAPTVPAVQIGTATVSFADCLHGMLRYHFYDDDGQFDGSIPLTRLSSVTTCGQAGANASTGSTSFYSGAWYDPATSGQGMLMDFSPAQNVLFAGWFTFVAPGSQDTGPAGQRWFTIQSHDFVPGISVLSGMPLYVTDGQGFDQAAIGSHPGTTQVGTADISFQSCTALTLHYSITGGDYQGRSGTLHLQRLAPAPAGCGL